MHVTNRFVDLIPVVASLAKVMGLKAIYIENAESDSRLVSSSDWVLLTNNQAFLDVEAVHEDEEPMPEPVRLACSSADAFDTGAPVESFIFSFAHR